MGPHIAAVLGYLVDPSLHHFVSKQTFLQLDAIKRKIQLRRARGKGGRGGGAERQPDFQICVMKKSSNYESKLRC